MAGIRDDRLAIWLTAATSGSNFVFTLLGVWLVDRLGRRKLTLGSLLGTPVAQNQLVAVVTRLFKARASCFPSDRHRAESGFVGRGVPAVCPELSLHQPPPVGP